MTLVEKKVSFIDHTQPYEVILSLYEYKKDVGLSSNAAIYRQLSIDLPRSLVFTKNGLRATDPRDIFASTKHPSLCTQAVLAPPVEWFLFSGIILHEKYKSPMIVDVSSDNSIRIAKRLCMRNANTGHDIGAVDIEMFVHGKYVVISFN